MRSTIVYGFNDKIRIDLGSDVDFIDIIAADKCKSIDGIIYKVVFTGVELLDFFTKHKVSEEEKAKITKENSYEVTFYDD